MRCHWKISVEGLGDLDDSLYYRPHYLGADISTYANPIKYIDFIPINLIFI